ncbi:hypothetical protein KQY27_05305 [Methanobrevibacter sp. TMH8]|uniref:hypothetical protein n=1 Tax=Methanobrevibacter sp. TMH8 TaxID=2848611 RepID=UPI001CC949D1|nr:hypothetical protein [Methanobrevibacter sp. TMH8]MBZ9570958.1 hypothetical protein [Methanobrevibacter sp. TMH8]
MKKIILISIMLITAILAINSASASEITIDENSTGGIKEAIKNGNSTIVLESGTYKGENNTKIELDSRLSNNITIKSKNPKNKAIIDCEKSWFIGNAGNLTLINLIIINGQGIEDGITQGVITNLGTITITNCSFMNNNLTIGSVINNIKVSDPEENITVGSAYIINSTFINNIAIQGSAIFNQGNITIKNSNFTNNSAITGGAIYNKEGFLEIYSSNFLNNKATGDENGGGAIFNDYSKIPIIIDSCSFINNFAGVGGSITSNGNLNILRSKFINNTATMGGGAVASSGGESSYICNIYDSSFSSNSAPIGGAILNMVTMNIFNCNFTNNKANESGAAISNYILSLNISNSNFNNNSSPKGSDIYLNVIQFPVFITYNTFLNSKNSIYYSNTDEILTGMKGNVSNVKISHNWWGTNNIKDKVINVKPINYFTTKIKANVANNKLYVTDKLRIYYYFVLNGTNNNANAKNKLKYFTTSLYYNGKLLKKIDGRVNTAHSIILNKLSNTIKTKSEKQELSIKYTARKLKTANSFIISYKSRKYTIVKILLKDNKRKKLSKKWIKVYKGKKYLGRAKTNSKGLAYLKIRTYKIKGKNKITTKYTGTGVYTSSKKTKIIRI